MPACRCDIGGDHVRRHTQANSWACPDRPSALLVTRSAARPGQVLFTLRAEATPAAWPVSDAGVLGRVLHGTTGDPNCDWHTCVCEECGATLLTATATALVPRGRILRGPPPPPPPPPLLTPILLGALMVCIYISIYIY